MKKACVIITALALLAPASAFPLDKNAEQKLLAQGYALLKVSNELGLIRTDVLQFSQKFKNPDQSDDFQLCQISGLIENITLAETICKYASITLGTLPYIQADHKLAQYEILEKELREDALKRLFSAYQNTGLAGANSEDKEIFDFVYQVKEKMSAATSIIEQVINIFQSQNSAKP
jgi:hemerythrin superfamily protein